MSQEALLRNPDTKGASTTRDNSQQSTSASSSNQVDVAEEREHLLSEIDRLKTDLWVFYGHRGVC